MFLSPPSPALSDILRRTTIYSAALRYTPLNSNCSPLPCPERVGEAKCIVYSGVNRCISECSGVYRRERHFYCNSYNSSFHMIANCFSFKVQPPWLRNINYIICYWRVNYINFKKLSLKCSADLDHHFPWLRNRNYLIDYWRVNCINYKRIGKWYFSVFFLFLFDFVLINIFFYFLLNLVYLIFGSCHKSIFRYKYVF